MTLVSECAPNSRNISRFILVSKDRAVQQRQLGLFGDYLFSSQDWRMTGGLAKDLSELVPQSPYGDALFPISGIVASFFRQASRRNF